MLVVSPVVLLVLGVLVARLAKSRRVWRRHGHFAFNAGTVILVLYAALSLGLLFDVPRLRRSVGGGVGSGTEWFVGSGLVSNTATWPLEDPRLAALVIASFMLYPFWFWLGTQVGFWAFGRSPKQTGLLGLLR